MRKIPWFIQLILVFVIAFVGARLVMTQVLSKDTVLGISMEPTLKDNDRLISIRHKHVARNDIVVIDAPDRTDNTLYIKRVIGMPGDSVFVKDGRLYINGKVQAQPYLKTKFMRNEIKTWGEETGEDTTGVHFTGDFNIATDRATQRSRVPAGEYFVMGDNRFYSHDGRAFGFVKAASVKSVVVLRYWPFSKVQIY